MNQKAAQLYKGKAKQISPQSDKILNEVFRKKPRKNVSFIKTQSAQLPPLHIGMLRQWLNEDRHCNPFVTNEEIIHFLL